MPARVERFGDFDLHRVLGAGSSATVYLAQDRRDQAWVALKILVPVGSAASQVDAQARFVREAELVQRLRHPHIVGLHAFGETAGRRWLAMEFVPGHSLDRHVQARHLLPIPVVAKVGERLALALRHAHGEGVVHRDIKPSNVILDLAGDGLRLTDFGTARLLDKVVTGTELMLGSPAYMAPELLAGRPADAASDLYGMGVLLFELLSGRRPHESASMGELLRQVANEPAPDVRSLRPEVPAALALAVGRLLDKDPRQRPSCTLAAAAGVAPELDLDGTARSTATGGALSR
jgi:serine/threonine-protein kinase